MGYERGKRVWRANQQHSWTFDFSFKSRRFHGSTGTMSKRDAERVARLEYERVIAEWHRANPNGTSKRVRSPEMTFAEAVAVYMDTRGDLDRNRAETAKHLLVLCQPEWIGAETLCSEIDMPLLFKVVTSRRRQPLMSREKKTLSGVLPPQRQVWAIETNRRVKRPFVAGMDRESDIILLSAAYVNRSTVDLIKRVLLFVGENYGVRLAPISWKKVRLVEAEPEIVALTFEEEQRLEEYLCDQDGYGDLVRFAVLTGLRLENFTELCWHQVDFDRGTITLNQKSANGRRKSHTIYMDEAIEQVLRAQVGRHPVHVFVFRASKTWINPKNGVSQTKGEAYPITYWGFRSWWVGCQKATGLTHITPHAFRRTAASRIVRFSGSLTAAQKLLGHTDIRTTAKHYARFTPDDALHAQRLVRIATQARMQAIRESDTASQAEHNGD